MKHVYIDESINLQAGIAAMIALEIDSRAIKEFTIEFYQIIKLIVAKFPTEIHGSRIIYPTPILHGLDFLRNSSQNRDNVGLNFKDIDDDFRFKVLATIVDMVNKFNLRIVRVGYLNYKELLDKGFPDEKMYSMNWATLSSYFNSVEHGEEYTFIMDGTHPAMMSKLSTYIRDSKSYQYVYDMRESTTIPNVERFLNNVFYVSMKYCELLQVVDVIGYLLQKKDYSKITGAKTDFGTQLIVIAETIKKDRLVEKFGTLQFSK
jgi:hypothetical protein